MKKFKEKELKSLDNIIGGQGYSIKFTNEKTKDEDGGISVRFDFEWKQEE